MNDATHIGGLNSTLANIASDMKGEGIASVSGCAGIKRKNVKNSFVKLQWK